MTDNLIIRTPNGDFDLFGNEDIVQTMSIFDLSDITKRTGEYTNALKFPPTNNNIRLIEYADEMTSVNTLPYKKVSAQIIVGGLVIRTGFIGITEVSDVINGRFYSGNTIYYDLIKNLYLSDLDWSAYDHIWNYANAVASSANTSGYFYPVMDYGGQTLGGDTVDVRKILPATFNKTILRLMIEQLGYTYDDDFDRDDFNVSILPYAKKNPSYPSEYLLLNSFEGSNLVDYGYDKSLQLVYDTLNGQSITVPIKPGDISPVVGLFYRAYRVQFSQAVSGTGTYWSQLNNEYTAGANGLYNYDLNVDFKTINTHYAFENVITSDFSTGPSLLNNRISVKLVVEKSGVITNIENIVTTTGVNFTGSISLNAGDKLYCTYKQIGEVLYQVDSGRVGSNPRYGTFNIRFYPEIDFTTNTFDLYLQDGLTFGNPIVYSTLFPKMKCSDFLKDIAVRFGIILSIDEDNKIIKATNINRISDNKPSALDLSDILDESQLPEQLFSLNSYAQNNNFKHKFDKSVVDIPNGTDYIMTINNPNLELNKDLYNSPFAPCENINFNSVITTGIDLYNTSTNKFDKEVEPRICFSEFVYGMFRFTDGTTTSGYLTTRRIWFIDDTIPEQCMGFGSNLIPKNSATLIDILQNLRLVKANFNLSIIHIKNFNPLLPVYVRQFQSYFILSNINQFNYTKPGLTELELIKLN